MSNTPDTALSFPLLVSADRPDLFADACGAGTDCVVIDLEDSVAPDSKAVVRRIPESALPSERSVTLYLRVNAVGTIWHRDDVSFARALRVDGVILPKVESPEEIITLRQALGAGQKIIALIETAIGLSRVEEIARVADRLAFGSLDLSEDLGCWHTQRALLPLRSRIVLAARLAGRPAPLDGVSVVVEEDDIIQDEAMHACELGFGGKFLIHARQLAPTRAGFCMEPENLDWMRNVAAIDGGAVPKAAGETFQIPVKVRAERLLSRSKARI